MTSSAPVPTLYLDVYALFQAGKFQAALDLLAASPVLRADLHHRQRGYALHNLFQYENAHRQMLKALETSRGSARGAVFADWAVMYMREHRYDEGYRCYHEALALIDHPENRTATLYNFGWTYLRRLHLQEARLHLEEALQQIRRSRDPDVRWWLTFVRCVLALHARLHGDWTLAEAQAQQALSGAKAGRARVFALHTVASTQRLMGDLGAARLTQAEALAEAGEGQAAETERLHLHLIDVLLGRPSQNKLEALIPLAAPYDAWRARLQLAQLDLARGQTQEALVTLESAVSIDEPYVLLDEAPALSALYVAGRAHGLTLPQAVTPCRAHLHLVTRAVPGLRVDGHLLPLDQALPIGILLYLHLTGPATPEELTRALMDVGEGDSERLSARIRRAVQDVAFFVGSGDLIRKAKGQLSLSPEWGVTHDLTEGTGRVLAELYGGWVLGLNSFQD